MKIKRQTSLIALALVLGLFSRLWIFAQAYAQQGRLDAFTFFIPYPAALLDDQFDEGFDHTQVPSPPNPAERDQIGDDIETTISIAVHRTGTIIYYDHWENGLEADLTSPTQITGDARTEVWGDNDASNGIPPTFTTDLLNAGDIITLISEVELDAAGSRDSSQVFFDGGDTLTAVGGSIAVTLAVWPIQDPAYTTVWGGDIRILYAGAWELYPTNQWGTDYIIPVGEDLDGTGANQREGFEVVGFNVQAAIDDTQVQIDLDGDGATDTTVTLDRGEQFTRVGNQVGIDTTDPGGSDPTKSVLVGAEIRSQDSAHPIQVNIFTANPDNIWEARAFTIIPADQWSTQYLAPRSSDGDYWLYNPDRSNSLVVRAQTDSGSTDITIPANSTVKYPAAGLSTATGVLFTNPNDSRPFYGVATLDAADTQDWGYALLPEERLTTQALVAWGPSHRPPPAGAGNESRVYVTAGSNTTVYVDHDSDGTADDNFGVSPRAEVSIIDSVTGNLDMTGAYLYTTDTVPFVAAWGQDENAPDALPSIDVGTSIIPLSSLNLQKTVELIDEADCTGSISDGILFDSSWNISIMPCTTLTLSTSRIYSPQLLLMCPILPLRIAPQSRMKQAVPPSPLTRAAIMGPVPFLPGVPISSFLRQQSTVGPGQSRIKPWQVHQIRVLEPILSP